MENDLDSLPVVCPACSAARAISLGREGPLHWFECRECGEQFYLREFETAAEKAERLASEQAEREEDEVI